MKVSVSLPDEDVEFLDDYAEAQGLSSRSAVLHKAVRLLRCLELAPAYEDADSTSRCNFRLVNLGSCQATEMNRAGRRTMPTRSRKLAWQATR